ncbi:glutaredoxin family protein [Undibacterium sp. TJN25]|uniref:glutaredoxin family protein n=1 Tax=Undibacterium sp. TJN25 TaxID=3413056 RepID=UPI003BF00168
MTEFTLYSRSYCHLCDDMLEALQSYTADHVFTVKLVDVDADDELVALYDELVPVLIGKKEGGTEQQICHYFLDHAKLKEFLS